MYVLTMVLGYPLSTAQIATLMGFEPTTSTVTGWRALRCSTGPSLICILCITHPTRCLLPLTAAQVGFEPTTSRLTVGHSAVELLSIKYQNELLLVVLHSLLLFVLLICIVLVSFLPPIVGLFAYADG